MMKKAVVIGLDGADWRLLEPWIQDNKLPTLGKLVSEGVSGRLRSTIRPESSVAWSSFSTGVNPGKHGVFGFVERVGQGYSFKLSNASSVHAQRFWDVLGREEVRVGLLNIPFTYPPRPVNGFMVTGMLTPGSDVSFAYPRTLQQQLLDHFEDYMFDASGSVKDKAVLIENVRAYTHQQKETALLLLQEQAWDLFTVIFTGPDRLQHFLWSDIDMQHPFYEPQSAHLYGNALLEHYQILDEAISEMLNYLHDNALVLIVSDHGFNGCARRFYVNQWLRERGFLELKRDGGFKFDLASWLSHIRSLSWLRRLKRIFLPMQWSSVDLQSKIFLRAIDWSHTKAYFGLDGGLRINLRGREPDGIVPTSEYNAIRHELHQELLALKYFKSKQPVLSEVFLREEVYCGPFVAKAPDLILEPQRDNVDPASNFILDGSLRTDQTKVFGSSFPYSANHALDGILIAWGPDIAGGGCVQGAQIIDLAPTVLASLDIAIPENMDGHVLSELFSPGSAPRSRYTATLDFEVNDSEKDFSLGEKETIENRLRNLGYID